MHGSSLKMFMLTAVVAVGLLFMFWAGFLPASVYPEVYRAIDNLPIAEHASAPYLQQYEGHWMLAFIPATKASDFVDCPAFTTIVGAHDGRFAGNASVPGYLLGIEASTSASGVISGLFYSGNREYRGTLQGGVHDGTGSGSWQDSESCAGTWSLVKSSPVVDPVQGKIVSLDGRVELVRTARADAWPEEALYAGDLLEVPAGGSAKVEIGLDQHLVSIGPNQSFTVPDAGGFVNIR